MSSHLSTRSFISAAFGTIVEYYDFALFSIFLPIISPYFFPASTKYESLVKAYGVLLLAVISRPLGGIFFGRIGDLFGRRRALGLSMFGIAISTLLIGFTPTYQSIGVWSIVIIMFAKIVQSFCFGGEYNGAGIYVVEHAKNHREGLVGSLLTAIAVFGSMLASLSAVITSLDFMPSWSWRLAFIFGGIIGVIGLFYRKNLLESPHFNPAPPHKFPLINLFKLFPKELIAGFFIGGFSTMPLTTVVTFINPVLITNAYFTENHAMLLQTFILFIGFIALVISGQLSDSKSPLTIMKWGALLLTLFAFPLLKAIDSGVYYIILLAEIAIVLFNEMLLGPSNALLKNIFPMKYRYRGSSLSFTLGMAVIGGLTPIVESALYSNTKHFTAIALWPISISLGTYLSLTVLNLKKPVLSTESIEAQNIQ